MHRHVAILLAGMVCTGAARAATVNIDIGDPGNSGTRYGGVGAAPDAGTFWTQTWTAGTTSNLPETIQRDVYHGLSTRAGGETGLSGY